MRCQLGGEKVQLLQVFGVVVEYLTCSSSSWDAIPSWYASMWSARRDT
jgi:hypothetical protein